MISKKEFVIIALCVVFYSTYSITGFYDKNISNYLVLYKGENKIVFKSIDVKDSTLRIIQFENVAKGMDYYDAIKVGDTLNLIGITDKLVYENFYGGTSLVWSRIKTINNKNLDEIKELAIRDSLLKQIVKSNRKTK